MSRTSFHWLTIGLLVAITLALMAGAGCGSGSETTDPSGTPATEGSSESETIPEASEPDPSSENEASPSAPEPTSSPAGDSDRATPALPLPTITRSSSDVPVLGSADAYVEGVGEEQDILPSIDHVDLNDDPSDDRVAYNSVPPTSGDHWSTSARCGFYVQLVPDELVVHNMEHSNIIVSYNLTTQEDFEALKGVYDDLPEIWREHFTVVRPYGGIAEDQVALSTWGVLDVMEGVDRARILRFFEHYVGKLGPEGPISCRGSQDSMPRG